MSSSTRILIVDDDIYLTGLTAEYLEAQNFTVTIKHNAADGLEAFEVGNFDICIFDVRMPVMDGFELAIAIRQIDEHVPIIFLTGQTEKEDRIKGFELGADDYVTKPFSMRELSLRIEALLKRTGRYQLESKFELGRYNFDSHARTLKITADVERLSEAEARLLRLFCTQQNGLVTRDLALREVWQDEDRLKSRSLNVYINKLRRRLEKDNRVEIINVYGTGYQLIVKDI